ncbi:MAG: RHS repeat-associated core domain-containing protein [Planctomycetes bacterium]|nr:RHS repeat-associated core domain-containing protein [Planctomycetota bacterium]MBL7043535.1 RHS repeat-associated core domain-containing protein [Pirellulaceae bacterium]
MPRIDCCFDALPSTLGASFEPEDLENCGSLQGQFPLVWNGVEGTGARWTSDPATAGDLTIELGCPSSQQGSMCTIDWAIGGTCNESGSVESPCNCSGVLHSVGVWFNDACCGLSGQPGAASAGIIIWTGEPIATGAPPRSVPPCTNLHPDDCCLVPGAQPSGSSDPCCPSPTTDSGQGRTRQGPPPAFSAAPVRYATGELAVRATDIESSGFGLPWGHTRSFANRLSVSQTLGNGFNWQVEQWPYLVIHHSGDVTVLSKANTGLWFQKIDGGYAPEFNVRETLILDQAAERYKLYDLDGTVTEFDSSTGMFQRMSDPGGNRIEVTAVNDNGYNVAQVEREYTSRGSTTTEQYLYEYDGTTGDQLLSSVTLRRKVDAGSWTNVKRASYTYYANGNAHGSEADLRTAKTEVWKDDQWSETGTTLYRYYNDLPGSSSSSSSSSSSGGGATGPARLLKYIVNPDAYRRLSEDPDVTNPLTASDLKVAEYADYYFEYDAKRRVTKELTNGGSQTYLLGYEQSENADGYNRWKYKTTETLPSGGQNIVYSNYAGQTMLRVLKSGSDEWYEFWKYNDSAQVTLHANPSAISGYDETKTDLLNETGGSYQYLKDNDGLIHTHEYDAASGYVSAEKIQKGESGTPIKLREYEYTSRPVDGSSSSSSSSSSGGPSEPAAWFTSKETVYPSDTDQTKKIVTTYSYTFYPDTCQVKEKVTTLPAVPTDQNGSGQTDTRREYFDQYGNLTWTMDERGFITRYNFDIVTGAMAQMIQDVDTSQVTDEPAGWETPTGGGLHLVTDFEHDDQGRTTQTLGPIHTLDIDGVATSVRRATWTVYKDVVAGLPTEPREVRTAQGYATGAQWDTYTLINPVSITKLDENGNVLEEIKATRASTTGKLLPTDTFAQSSYVAWTTHQYTECCLRSSTRIYHTIPASGEGESGTNYDQTDFEYNASRIMNRQRTPGGTITFTVFDVRGNPTKVYVGTNDTGATTGDPTGGGAEGNNMVLVTESEYDNGTDGGDGNLTKQPQHVDASTRRVASHTYDWRNRRTDTDGEIDFYEKAYHDNLDRVTKTERYDTTANGNLISRNETKYDDRGRVYQTIRYGVDPSTGTVGNALTDNTWYDAAGNVIKQSPAGSKLFTKTVYDGLGRRTKQYRGFDIDETAYADASSVTGDTILEQTETTYDAASNAIQTTRRQRYHNATGTGELNGPSGVQPKARITYAAAWHDPIGRTVATADYGTNGGSTLSRPNTIPGRSDTILVTSMTYNSAGQLCNQTNPGGVTTCFQYDAVGRQTEQVLNCVEISSSSSSSSSSGALESDDTNVTVLTGYNADGNVKSITAKNSFTGDQVSQYVYGTTLSNSGIASSLLKRGEIYPDSDDVADPLGNGPDGIYDRIEFKYNRQGEVTEIKDQNETVHAFDYDKLGRQTHDRVTALGTGVDGAVRRLSTSYEVRGMREKITSWNGETVGSGSVVNEVQFAYNDFGQITADYQAHGGTVNTSTTPKVQYAYADGSSNTIRPTTITYPDGRVITYDYGSSGSTSDALSRIASIIDDDAGSTHLADYSYVGLSTFVEADHTEPDIKYTLVGTAGGNDPDTGDIYRGLDRFGRVKDSYWYDYGTSTDVDRIKYGYDRNGNRTWRENTVAASYGKHFDELYNYDLIDRLKTMDRGDLDNLKSEIQNLKFSQDWQLDATGNWRNFREDDDGDGTWDLNQQRTANTVNEISDIAETVGPSWVTPVHNRAGNMTTIPKPADPTASFTATYDAWNRLVKIEEGSDKVAEYEYDGAKRRSVKKTYISGSLDETRHFYYTQPAKWQVVEERVGSATDAERQFVWGLRYVDDIVQRDRDTNGDGSLDERLYGLADANWNATSVVAPDGAVVERYAYCAYGYTEVLTSSFANRVTSQHAWEVRYAGYRWDIESGLHCVRHRFYLSILGSWIQRDPLGYAEGPNIYEYASGNPINGTDAHGLRVDIIIIVVVVLIIGGAVFIWLSCESKKAVNRTSSSDMRCKGNPKFEEGADLALSCGFPTAVNWARDKDEISVRCTEKDLGGAVTQFPAPGVSSGMSTTLSVGESCNASDVAMQIVAEYYRQNQAAVDALEPDVDAIDTQSKRLNKLYQCLHDMGMPPKRTYKHIDEKPENISELRQKVPNSEEQDLDSN